MTNRRKSEPKIQNQILESSQRLELRRKYSAMSLEDQKDIKYSQRLNVKENLKSFIDIKITLAKEDKGYGFAFNCLYNRIYISQIAPKGIAQIDGRMRIGDQLVSVNNINLENVTEEISKYMLQNAGPIIYLVIRRFESKPLRIKKFDVKTDKRLDKNVFPSNEDNVHEEEKIKDLKFQTFVYKLSKQKEEDLGIIIEESYDHSTQEPTSYFWISDIIPDGPSHTDGRLQIHDIILQVDTNSFQSAKYEEAISFMKSSKTTVTIYIGRYVEINQK